MNKISVGISAKNEVVSIARTIASAVDIVGEVLVVDGGSRDNTDPARVVEIARPGFAAQRNFGAVAARNDGFFMLDADEVFDVDLGAFVAKCVSESVNDNFAFVSTRCKH